MRAVTITHCAGKENLNADALSRNPHNPPPDNGIGEGEVQIAMITNASSVSDLEKTSNNSEVTIADMLESQDCEEGISQPNDFAQEQQKDQTVLEIKHFLKDGKLPCDENRAKKVVLQGNKS